MIGSHLLLCVVMVLSADTYTCVVRFYVMLLLLMCRLPSCAARKLMHCQRCSVAISALKDQHTGASAHCMLNSAA